MNATSKIAAAAFSLAAAATLALSACTTGTSSADPPTETPDPAGGSAEHPTIVLVHGAFADASGWEGVIDRLRDGGYPVLAVANPLRGLGKDSAYLRGVLDTIDGPLVLVGHSYGGAVITNAATGDPDVAALVYVAAFVPDEGEVLGQFADPEAYPGALLGPDSLVHRPSPDGEDEVSIDPDRFGEIFAADLPTDVTANLATRQRPVASTVFGEPSGPAAWRDIPSWYQVSTEDKAISPAAQRFFADRAGSETVEVEASHAAFISHERATAELIESAANAAR
ncbi:alpha/beta hydrolase [Agromyces protaetiae]|uniref:Alpha/beta hydrolase n=1 Tax=Agromyces protaetiae TaxID=2509455 RepID=A0A4P6FID1_9MICO|nr:alpha/beta hydrolase [Agromyces protaetiae]QAY73727.1 alpha/beta hydrolase [Agromyces protaetiae]